MEPVWGNPPPPSPVTEAAPAGPPRVHLPAPKPISGRSGFLWDNRQIEYPKEDDRGVPLEGKAVQQPPDLLPVVRDAPLKAEIRRLKKRENKRNAYYWHYDVGIRYSHFLDEHGIDWYGFYIGPNFFWLRWQNHHLWWFDAAQSRWTYWHQGFWWWQDPHKPDEVFVDIGNRYYPYNDLVQAQKQGNSPN